MNEDLRDVFAMAALAGMLPGLNKWVTPNGDVDAEAHIAMAQLAYRFANAIMRKL